MERKPQIALLDRVFLDVPRPLAPDLVKRSNVRLIVCGDTFERYEYQEPYFYNMAAAPVSEGVRKDRARDSRRRLDNLRRVKQRMRRLVASNVSAWGQIPKFVTFTFARNIRDLSEANRLWSLFVKRLTYEMGPQKSLTVVEFQKRGAVHYHTLFFSMPFTSGLKAKLAPIWGHGFIHVKGIRHVKNVSAYITKYLQEDLVDSRLAGRKAYFCSRGLKKPLEYRDAIDVARVESSCIMVPTTEKVYLSHHFGAIHYTQGHIKRV